MKFFHNPSTIFTTLSFIPAFNGKTTSQLPALNRKDSSYILLDSADFFLFRNGYLIECHYDVDKEKEDLYQKQSLFSNLPEGGVEFFNQRKLGPTERFYTGHIRESSNNYNKYILSNLPNGMDSDARIIQKRQNFAEFTDRGLLQKRKVIVKKFSWDNPFQEPEVIRVFEHYELPITKNSKKIFAALQPHTFIDKEVLASFAPLYPENLNHGPVDSVFMRLAITDYLGSNYDLKLKELYESNLPYMQRRVFSIYMTAAPDLLAVRNPSGFTYHESNVFYNNPLCDTPHPTSFIYSATKDTEPSNPYQHLLLRSQIWDSPQSRPLVYKGDMFRLSNKETSALPFCFGVTNFETKVYNFALPQLHLQIACYLGMFRPELYRSEEALQYIREFEHWEHNESYHGLILCILECLWTQYLIATINPRAYSERDAEDLVEMITLGITIIEKSLTPRATKDLDKTLCADIQTMCQRLKASPLACYDEELYHKLEYRRFFLRDTSFCLFVVALRLVLLTNFQRRDNPESFAKAQKNKVK